MDDNVMNFMAHRAKTTAAVLRGWHRRVDAWLAKAGLDRAGVEAEFASLGVNEEKQAPDVAHCRKDAQRASRAFDVVARDGGQGSG